MINAPSKNEECFKWALIGVLHHEEIKNNLERISRLRPYEKQCNWIGFNFPVSIKKTDKLEKNNQGIAVNELFSNKKSQIYIQPAGQNATRSFKIRLTY